MPRSTLVRRPRDGGFFVTTLRPSATQQLWVGPTGEPHSHQRASAAADEWCATLCGQGCSHCMLQGAGEFFPGPEVHQSFSSGSPRCVLCQGQTSRHCWSPDICWSSGASGPPLTSSKKDRKAVPRCNPRSGSQTSAHHSVSTLSSSFVDCGKLHDTPKWS